MEEALPQRPERKRGRRKPSSEERPTDGVEGAGCRGKESMTVVDHATFSSDISRRGETISNAVEDVSLPEDDGLRYDFEYLDHTADIQIHAWGRNLQHAFESAALGMYNYMTPLKGVVVDETCTTTAEVEGHDMESLLFQFLDELLFLFHTESLVAKEVTITDLDRDSWRIKCTLRGERFKQGHHECGTEVKAITYSAMQIVEEGDSAQVYVIVDI